jgi:hypothetical protein
MKTRSIVLNSATSPKLCVVLGIIQGFARVQILSGPTIESGFEIIHLNSADWREADKTDFEKFRVLCVEDYLKPI